MKLPKLFHEFSRIASTNSFRSSFFATIIASILTIAAMYMIYQTARQEISDQIDSRLSAEAARLERNHEYRTSLDLYSPQTGITERVQTESAMSYCLTPQTSTTNKLINRSKERMLDISFNDLCTIHDNLNEFNNDSSDLSYLYSDDNKNIMRVLITPLSNDYLLVVGYDMRNERRILHSMLIMVGISTGILILASFFGSFFISRTILHSTSRISRTARRIADGDFGERVKVRDSDSSEMQQLAGDLNHMLERIDNLITSQRQVTNNIAHDLRSPLNRLRSRMEVALIDRNRSTTELRDVIADSIEDAERLLQTFNAMLSIAQVESRARDDFENTSLSQICEDLAEMYDVLAEDGLHTFTATIHNDLNVIGNRQLIAQAITNLLDNAVKYTPEGGHITLDLKQQNKQIIVGVGDNGVGIPEADRERVLKRFVRLDSARSTPGNGLGLSMVSAIINLHGGEIKLLDNHPGLRIELHFPNAETFLKQHSTKKKAPPTEAEKALL